MRLWQMTDHKSELQRFYLQAPYVEAAYQEARYELEDCEYEVNLAAEHYNKHGPELQPLIAILSNKVSNFEFDARSTTRRGKGGDVSMVRTKAEIVSLHARLLNAQMKARACDRHWKVLLKDCQRYEDWLSGKEISASDTNWCIMATQTEHAGMPAGPFVSRALDWTLDQFNRGLVHVSEALYSMRAAKCMRVCCRMLALLCGFMSIVTLWSELVMSSDLHSPIGALIGAYRPPDDLHAKDSIVVQAVAFIGLAYTSICTYWSLFRLNLGWAYTLQGPQLSSPSSLLFNGIYFSRLQFSLGYNFLLALNAPRTQQTAFHKLMANMQTIPLFGTSLTVYMPILMIVIALCTLFNVFTRIVSLCGLESQDPVGKCCSFSSTRNAGSNGDDEMLLFNDDEKERYLEGKKLVKNEIKHMVQELKLAAGSNNGLLSDVSQTSNSSSEHDHYEVELGTGTRHHYNSSQGRQSKYAPVVQGSQKQKSVKNKMHAGQIFDRLSDDDDNDGGDDDNEEGYTHTTQPTYLSRDGRASDKDRGSLFGNSTSNIRSSSPRPGRRIGNMDMPTVDISRSSSRDSRDSRRGVHAGIGRESPYSSAHGSSSSSRHGSRQPSPAHGASNINQMHPRAYDNISDDDDGNAFGGRYSGAAMNEQTLHSYTQSSHHRNDHATAASRAPAIMQPLSLDDDDEEFYGGRYG
jgi:hypothetical protein